ncbi:hypothetical protein M011DRAFT_487258 [Sporormia fimetaria CBS 119925]|uniref:SprT-like domain-containing protein n=1 Tax=Sporormia fimetaria CBS 119925 TaxID=1340428 RepID=A0A6A6V9B4_9PLEO|nr:hypothetical protein M011DRAFT_487258 [Sporormia fimetaria CBS 119925]
MSITDEAAALEAIATLDPLSNEQHHALTSINSILQNNEPFVDVHELFRHYDVLYFRSLLTQRVEVLWSARLTLCAGICELSKDPETGKFTRIRLKLSGPLLQYRPRSDTVNTLLHEAIHAYLFVTTSWRHSRGDDGTGHGVGFQLLADAINRHGNYEVTVYHAFHDEVDSYRTHVWQCDGPCREQPPFFGLVKRSMNRAPGKSDSWWEKHQAECGGTYTKIQEPELTKKQRDALSSKKRAGLQKNKLDAWVKVGATGKSKDSEPSSGDITCSKRKAVVTLGTALDDRVAVEGPKRARRESDAPTADDESLEMPAIMVECPICCLRLPEPNINEHLDRVHPP